MISRVFAAALVAGFLAACAATILQAFLTTPLILRAEAFEKSAFLGHERAIVHLAHAGPSDRAASPAHEHPDEGGWKPTEGLSRAAFTGSATLVSAVGYALLLLALMLAVGSEPTIGGALRWGMAGFVAVSLAPAIGLPPELPGAGGGSLVLRQAWWLFAAFGTGLGLYLVALDRKPIAIALGVAAIVAPHVVGAPHGGEGGAVPATLAAQFAARSLAVAFVFWALLGLSLGWIWPRLGRKQQDATLTA